MANGERDALDVSSDAPGDGYTSKAEETVSSGAGGDGGAAGHRRECGQHEMLRAVDPEQRKEVGLSWLTRVRSPTREPGAPKPAARDGTTWRGTQTQVAEEQKKRHPVSVYETKTGVVRTEPVRRDKEREQTRVEASLTPQDMNGRMLSANALRTHVKTGGTITGSGGMFFASPKAIRPRSKRISPLVPCTLSELGCRKKLEASRQRERILNAHNTRMRRMLSERKRRKRPKRW